MQQLSKKGIKNLFNSFEESNGLRIFNKKGKVLIRKGKPGEVIKTVLSDGAETTKTLDDKDVVVKNLDGEGEEYAPKDLHLDNYILDGELSEEWVKATPKGSVRGFEYQGGEMEFMAPWNEMMVCKPGDFIVNPIGGDPDDIYRVKRSVWDNTYEPA